MSKHVEELCAGFDRLRAELNRRPMTAAEKAAVRVMESRVKAARHWAAQQGAVQGGLFGDDTPREPIIRAPYSDTGTSLQAAHGVIKSGSAKKWRRWCLVRLEQAAHGCICDELVAIAERHTGRSMHSNISARLNGLEGDGLVIRDGHSRKTRSGRLAGIYRITEAGRRARSRKGEQ